MKKPLVFTNLFIIVACFAVVGCSDDNPLLSMDKEKAYQLLHPSKVNISTCIDFEMLPEEKKKQLSEQFISAAIMECEKQYRELADIFNTNGLSNIESSHFNREFFIYKKEVLDPYIKKIDDEKRKAREIELAKIRKEQEIQWKKDEALQIHNSKINDLVRKRNRLNADRNGNIDTYERYKEEYNNLLRKTAGGKNPQLLKMLQSRKELMEKYGHAVESLGSEIEKMDQQIQSLKSNPPKV